MDKRLEERYMVLKLNKFSKEKKLLLQNYMRGLGIPKEAFIDCVVIEEDWPQYEMVVDSIFNKEDWPIYAGVLNEKAAD